MICSFRIVKFPPSSFVKGPETTNFSVLKWWAAKCLCRIPITLGMMPLMEVVVIMVQEAIVNWIWFSSYAHAILASVFAIFLRNPHITWDGSIGGCLYVDSCRISYKHPENADLWWNGRLKVARCNLKFLIAASPYDVSLLLRFHFPIFQNIFLWRAFTMSIFILVYFWSYQQLFWPLKN